MTITNAQTSSFTYQGKLNDGALPATGTYQMQFGLFDASSGGDQIGGTQASAVTATNGVFTTNLNFGETAFDGTARFLQISVFSAALNAFVELNPRQQITSSPYSIKSSTTDTATNALNLGGTSADQFVVTSDPRMTDARPPTAGSNLYIQAGAHQAGVDISIGGEVTAAGFDTDGGYRIGGSSVLRISGTENLFVGLGSGLATSTGANNTMVGRDAGLANSTGNFNSFFGRNAGVTNTTGSSNTIIGGGANVATGNLSFATAIGASAVVSANNTIVLGRTGGQDTVQVPGILNVAGQYNIGGNRVLSVAGTENLFVGENSGTANTTGSANSFFGLNSGLSNTTGASNSFFGRGSGFGNTTGVDNAFFGRSAGFSNTTGTNNAFFGRSTGLANTIGTFNSFFGSLTGDSNTTGNNNTFVGAAAGSANTSGNANTFIGLQAGEGSTTGDDNVFIGTNAGNSNTTGSTNTYLGYNAKGNAAITNATAIGANAFVSQSNQIMLGTDVNVVLVPGRTVTNILRINEYGASGSVALCRNPAFEVALCSSSLRYKTNIADYRSGLDLVKRLRPITFDWKEGGMNDLGLGAEDVEAIEPLLVHYNDKGEVEGVKYDRIGVVLLNAVKEQQAQIERQQKLIDGLKKLVCRTNAQADECREDK